MFLKVFLAWTVRWNADREPKVEPASKEEKGRGMWINLDQRVILWGKQTDVERAQQKPQLLMWDQF